MRSSIWELKHAFPKWLFGIMKNVTHLWRTWFFMALKFWSQHMDYLPEIFMCFHVLWSKVNNVIMITTNTDELSFYFFFLVVLKGYVQIL